MLELKLKRMTCLAVRSCQEKAYKKLLPCNDSFQICIYCMETDSSQLYSKQHCAFILHMCLKCA